MPVTTLWRQYEQLLRLPFRPEELEWKIQSGSDKFGARAVIVPYVDARAIRRRLDDVFGVFGHQLLLNCIAGVQGQNATTLIAVLQILRPDGNWITRSELCEVTDIEPMKGAASGALKRVAASIGIGAYLYDFPEYVLTEKNGCVVADRADYKTGCVNYWKCGEKKYFWRAPTGAGEAPRGIPPQFLPTPDQARAFESWTFDPARDAHPDGRLLTAPVAPPSVPVIEVSHAEESGAERGSEPEDRPVAAGEPSRPVQSAAPVVVRPGGAGIKYERLQAGTDASQGFCDAWNFAVSQEHKLHYDRFTAALVNKPLADPEREALRFLARVLAADGGPFEAAKLTLEASRLAAPQAVRKRLLDVIATKSQKVAGCSVGKVQ